MRLRFPLLKFSSAIPLLTAGAVFLLVGWFSGSRPGRSLENLTNDWRFRLRGKMPIRVPITIIEIDQGSMETPGVPPLIFWGEKHARVIRILRESGARAIGFDLIQPLSLSNQFGFGETKVDPDQLQALEIASTPHLVLASKLNLLPSGKVSETLPNEVFRTALALGGGGMGFVNTTPDSDDVVRSFRLADIDPVTGQQNPSFVLEIARIATGKEPKIQNGKLTFGSRTLALQPDGTCLVDYRGPNGTFPRISYRDLLARPASFRSQLQGQICLIGTTSYELQDYHAVPFASSGGYAGRIMAGVEVNANKVSTLLGGGIWRAGPMLTWACILLMVVVATPCCTFLRLHWVIPSLLFLTASWIILCALLFVGRGWQLPITPVILVLASSGFLLVMARLREESARKREIESTFGRYVSPAVLQHLMQTPGAAELGGKRQVITVLFSDIRGFTARSEQLEPEQVTQFLNLYLGKMVEIVFANGGTIDKYIGDAVMAVWNWPTHQPDHALRAARAALQMQQEVERNAAQWQEHGFSTLCIGVGIHTGTAVLGNIGSPRRMESTAIGDTVNVASRLESLTKEISKTLCSNILLSEAVREAIEASEGENGASEFCFLPAGDTTIRGRIDTLKLYAIIPAKSEKLMGNK
jgi:adenylate cyclase